MSKMDLWERLSKTDPSQTKSFKRGGGFTGTAVKPIYTVQRMTEEFGPCGIGWGITEPKFEIVHGDNKEILVFCTVSIWISEDNGLQYIYGVGGDKVVTHIKANEQYKRPERWENDDEAFKKAFTDAVGNAMKYLGMSADVHMGLFDDSKYVTARKKEIEDNAKGPEDRTPQEILDQFHDRVRDIPIGDREGFEQAWNEEKSTLSKVQRTSKEAYDKFIAELHRTLHERKLDQTGGSENAPNTAGKQEPDASGGDSPARIKAREMLKAWKASPHLTALETSMKSAGFLTVGADGWVVKPDSHLGVIREAEPEVFHMFAGEIDKLRIALSKGKAA
jgi:hypothetical protein